jgi:hypothetical protein
MKIVHDLFKNLKGQWKINRSFNSSELGRVLGTAYFIGLNKDTLYYHEEGVWEFTNHTGQKQSQRISKNYSYRYYNNQISKYFADGRLFYNLQFTDESLDKAIAEHQCNNDTYHALYNFINDNQFTLIYIVKGPSKQEGIMTTFEREKNQHLTGASDRA